MNKFYSLLQTGVSAIALSCLAGTVFAADVASEGELKSALQTGSDATLTGDILLTAGGGRRRFYDRRQFSYAVGKIGRGG